MKKSAIRNLVSVILIAIVAALLLHGTPSAGPGVYNVGIHQVSDVNPLLLIAVFLLLVVSVILRLRRKDGLRGKGSTKKKE